MVWFGRFGLIDMFDMFFYISQHSHQCWIKVSLSARVSDGITTFFCKSKRTHFPSIPLQFGTIFVMWISQCSSAVIALLSGFVFPPHFLSEAENLSGSNPGAIKTGQVTCYSASCSVKGSTEPPLQNFDLKIDFI